VAARPDFQERVGQALADRYAGREAPQHVEQQIYGGFYNANDKKVLEDFKAAGWRDRAQLVEQLNDRRLKQLGMRLVFLNAPEFTSHGYQLAARAAIRDRWLTNDPSKPWTTKAAVEHQLHEIISGEALDQSRVKELQAFYQARVSQIDT
jgi:exodeoxyribonuclease-1